MDIVITASVRLVIACASVFVKGGDPLPHLGTDNAVCIQQTVEVCGNQGLSGCGTPQEPA